MIWKTKIFSIHFFKRSLRVEGRIVKLACGALLLQLSACATVPEPRTPLVVVPYVDYERYMGTWYEIARFPHSFEQGCVATTATYRLVKDEGYFEVVNRCHEKTVDGPLREVVGKVWTQDPPIQAKLKISFFSPFAGDYWIIDLAEDYRYAVVSAPDRDLLWILSRTPQLAPTDRERILEHVRRQGLDVSRLEYPPQIP